MAFAAKDVIVKRAREQLQGEGSGLLQMIVDGLASLPSSTASSEENGGNQDTVVCKVDAADPTLSTQLQAWSSWVSDALFPGQPLQQPQYAALASALTAAVSEIVPGSSPGAIAPDALAAAFAVDSAGAGAVGPERLSHSLAALATACGADGSAAAATAVLESLLSKLQSQAGQLQQQAASAPAASAGMGAGAGDGNDSEDELDKLLAEDTVPGDAGAGDEDDVVPPSDQTPAAAAPAAPAANATAGEDDEDDDALSLGLSRSTSIASASAAPAAAAGAVATAVARVGPPALGSAVQHDSAKSLGGKSMGALSRALSAASSDGLDDLPDNLDAMEVRGALHGGGGGGKGPRTKPLLAGLMESEQGKGAMAAMPTDLRDWSNLKSKQPGAAMVAPPGRPPPGARGGPGASSMRGPAGGHLVPLPGKPGAPGAPPPAAPPPAHAAAPPLLSSRTDGPKANPLHNALMNGSATRQSQDRASHQPPQQHGSHASSGSGNSFVSRKNSNTSGGIPAGRQRSLNSHLSRKASISEPGPLGPQAEWKQLPALGHGVRLHPHELRQPSSGNMRGSVMAAGTVGKSVAISAPGLADDKLPSLPALMGARGAPPRAAELLRNASRGARADSHHASHQSLPGLARGGVTQQASRALRMPSKKSFKGDRDF